jgi:nucleotide-binding universal stress UspA family protein
MFKDLLVPVVLGTVPTQAIDVACILAVTHGHVTGLIGVSLVTPLMSMPDVFPGGIYENYSAAARAAAAGLRDEVDACLARHPVAGASQLAESPWLTTAEIALVHSRYADLVVLGRVPDGPSEVERTLFGSLLLHSGRPLLLVPQDARPTVPPARIVLAWKPCAESTRALHDAMPLLKRADLVQLLMIDPQVDGLHHGELPGADIGAHLSRHDIAVEAISLPRAGGSDAEVLLRHAQEAGADLIVAGGYGHTRVREQVFGGVTRALFEQKRVPVLFSH